VQNRSAGAYHWALLPRHVSAKLRKVVGGGALAHKLGGKPGETVVLLKQFFLPNSGAEMVVVSS